MEQVIWSSPFKHIEHISCMVSKLVHSGFYISAKNYDLFRRDFIYKLEQVGENLYVPLNRNYKQVGNPNKEFINYQELPDRYIIQLTPGQLKEISFNDEGYMFNDECPPWLNRSSARKYLNRIEKLALVLKP